jgi:hypothetical protein
MRARTAADPARWNTDNVRTVYPPLEGATFVGRDGTVWIGLHETERGNPWLILNPDGSLYGRLTVPTNVKVTMGERSRFWGSEYDENDIQSVVRFRITR